MPQVNQAEQPSNPNVTVDSAISTIRVNGDFYSKWSEDDHLVFNPNGVANESEFRIFWGEETQKLHSTRHVNRTAEGTSINIGAFIPGTGNVNSTFITLILVFLGNVGENELSFKITKHDYDNIIQAAHTRKQEAAEHIVSDPLVFVHFGNITVGVNWDLLVTDPSETKSIYTSSQQSSQAISLLFNLGKVLDDIQAAGRVKSKPVYTRTSEKVTLKTIGERTIYKRKGSRVKYVKYDGHLKPLKEVKIALKRV